MMRIPRRLFGLFLALAWLASPGALQAGRACPHHSAVPAAVQPQDDAHAHHAPADAEGHDGAPCSCLGSCVLTGTPALPTAHAVEAGAASGALFQATPAPADAPRSSITPHRLPWPHAPPVSLI